VETLFFLLLLLLLLLLFVLSNRYGVSMWGVRRVYENLVGRTEGKRPLERPRFRWEDNIKLDLTETGIDGANWIQLAQDRVQWLAFGNTVINLRVP
jgi:hypothetical protein